MTEENYESLCDHEKRIRALEDRVREMWNDFHNRLVTLEREGGH